VIELLFLDIETPNNHCNPSSSKLWSATPKTFLLSFGRRHDVILARRNRVAFRTGRMPLLDRLRFYIVEASFGRSLD
jgi:hypothetical protein